MTFPPSACSIEDAEPASVAAAAAAASAAAAAASECKVAKWRQAQSFGYARNAKVH